MKPDLHKALRAFEGLEKALKDHVAMLEEHAKQMAENHEVAASYAGAVDALRAQSAEIARKMREKK